MGSCCSGYRGKSHADTAEDVDVSENQTKACQKPTPEFAPLVRHHVFVKNTFINTLDGEVDPVGRRSQSTPAAMRFSSGAAAILSVESAPSLDLSPEPSVSSDASFDYVPTDVDQSEDPQLFSQSGHASSVSPYGSPPPQEAVWTRPQDFQPRAVGQAGSFKGRVESCVTLAQSFLSVWPVIGSESKQSKTGWSITIFVKKEHAIHAEQVLAHSKHSMLQAAHSTTNLFWLGYGKDPFVRVPHGFAMIFWEVVPTSTTCWTLIQQGSCTPTCSCDHPKDRQNVVLQVSLID